MAEEVTNHADTYQRHGDLDPSKWDEAETVADRPNDTPLRGEDKPAVPNTTFGQRAKATTSNAKAVDADTADAEDKSVTSAATKARRTKKK